MRAIRRYTWGTAAALVAALVAAGCGGTTTTKQTPQKTTPAATSPKELVLPRQDAALEARVGEEHVRALTTAGCVLGVYDEEEPEHIKAGSPLVGKTYPPTTGQHYEDWGAFGRYEDPVPDGNVVHNLEHGGVVVWLGDEVDAATTDAIDALLDDGEKWMVVPRPDDELVPGLFSAAWAKGLYCPPTALTELGPEATATHLDAWFVAVQSTGSEAEKDIPAYAGAMKEPTPSRDISQAPPEF